jgi:hypothetical protein
VREAADPLLALGLAPGPLELLRLGGASLEEPDSASMKSMNWRYSDCQFSITACPNADEVRYLPREIVGSPCATCSWL